MRMSIVGSYRWSDSGQAITFEGIRSQMVAKAHRSQHAPQPIYQVRELGEMAYKASSSRFLVGIYNTDDFLV